MRNMLSLNDSLMHPRDSIHAYGNDRSGYNSHGYDSHGYDSYGYDSYGYVSNDGYGSTGLSYSKPFDPFAVLACIVFTVFLLYIYFHCIVNKSCLIIANCKSAVDDGMRSMEENEGRQVTDTALHTLMRGTQQWQPYSERGFH